jgi:hypothetical protein
MFALEQLVREIAREQVHAALAAIESPARDEWLDSTEAAEYLGYSVGHLHNLRAVVPSYKVGGRRRYRRSELNAYIEGWWGADEAAGPFARTVMLSRERFEALARRVEDRLRDDRDGFLDEVSKAASLGPSRKPVHHLVEPEQLPHLRAGRRLFCDRADPRVWVEHGGRAQVVEAERLCTATLPRLRSVEWQLVARERAALELLEPPLIRGGSS